MTAQDPFDGKDQSVCGTVAVDGLQGVCRARWMITAGRWGQGRDNRPVNMDEALQEGRCDGAHDLGSLPGAGHRPNQSGALHERLYLGASDGGAVLPGINDKNSIVTTDKSWLGKSPAFRHHQTGPVPGHCIAILPDCHEDSPDCRGACSTIVHTHTFDGAAGARVEYF